MTNKFLKLWRRVYRAPRPKFRDGDLDGFKPQPVKLIAWEDQTKHSIVWLDTDALVKENMAVHESVGQPPEPGWGTYWTVTEIVTGLATFHLYPSEDAARAAASMMLRCLNWRRRHPETGAPAFVPKVWGGDDFMPKAIVRAALEWAEEDFEAIMELYREYNDEQEKGEAARGH
jgi:hypothetical protein